jgi:hypothetical protein
MSRKLLLIALAAVGCATALPFAIALHAEPPAGRSKPNVSNEQSSLNQYTDKQRLLREDGRTANKERPRPEPIHLLNEEVDMKDFAAAPMKLKEALMLLAERLAIKNNGEDLPIVLDIEAFRKAAPDTDVSDLYDLEIRFQPVPRRLTLAEVLRVALAQIPQQNATFVIRRSYVEITTRAAVGLKSLLSQEIIMQAQDRPLDEMMGKLASASGITILLDPRAGKSLKKRVSATFRNNVSVGTAIYLLSDMVGLKAVPLPDSVYITTPSEPRRSSES